MRTELSPKELLAIGLANPDKHIMHVADPRIGARVLLAFDSREERWAFMGAYEADAQGAVDAAYKAGAEI